jgi:hypothetical protein
MRISIVCLALLAAPASASPPLSVPEALRVPDGNAMVWKASATGWQIYTCATDGTWKLKAPDAVLRDDAGKQIGKHFAGPTWEASDGSRVVGELKAKADAPDASAIPWLLLAAKSHAGEGTLAKVSFIQRVSTTGGKAPASGCDAAHGGAEQRVAYTAIYQLYAPR